LACNKLFYFLPLFRQKGLKHNFMKMVWRQLLKLNQNCCKKRSFLLYGTFFCFCLPALSQVSFRVHLDSSIRRSLTGRLFVYTTTDTAKAVPDELNYSQPMFAL